MNHGGGQGGRVVADRRLWLTADGERLVEDGDPDAAFLWSVAGRSVPATDAARLGYTPIAGPPATSVHEDKALEPEGDKGDDPDPSGDNEGDPGDDEPVVDLAIPDAPKPRTRARRAKG